MLKALWKDEAGQSMVEYVLILGLITVLLIAGVTAIGKKGQQAVNKVSDAFNQITV